MPAQNVPTDIWPTEGYGVPLPWDHYQQMAAKVKAIKGKAMVFINRSSRHPRLLCRFLHGSPELNYTVGGGANRVERGELVIYSWDRKGRACWPFLRAQT